MHVVTLFRRFFPLLGRTRWLLIPAIGLLLVSTCADLLTIAIFAHIVDHALSHGDLGALPAPAVLWIVIALVGGLAGAGGTLLSATVTERLIQRLRNQLYEHVYRMPRIARSDFGPGDLIARHIGDVESVEHLVSSGLITGVVAAISAVVFAVAAFAVRWELAAVAFILVPLVGLVLHRCSDPLRRVSRIERQVNGLLNAEVSEGLSNADVIIADNQAVRHRHRLDALGTRWRRARMTELAISTGFRQLTKMVELLCLLAIIAVGVWEIARGRLTTGGLIAMTGYIGYLYPQIRQVADLAMSTTAATAAGDRITDVLDVPVARPGPPHPKAPAPRGPAGVELTNVFARYPGSDRAVLCGLDLRVAPGEIVAVTGRSGAGKSTLAALLVAFLDPVGGTITLGDHDISDMSAEDIRARVGLLPQQPAIFTETVTENIRHGRPDADLAAVIAAARSAGAHEFITELPIGYDTVLGAYGTALSGGQQQRIALARALVRDTPILVLDEPTTGLDRDTVLALMTDIRRAVGSRTTILITHDRQVARFADRVVHIDHGVMRPPRHSAASADQLAG
ncbi:ABC transporter ATP-binding protein [Williamsia sp. 1135]|uniref:ABC transporter ATP-binding protein n=1 Tax=Williamsia sp. 1135 TaxID=1889262 RepID=UPI000A1008A2|nr:ABC transporter ATP-binding protein [Williamsia sp. 1135]ORM34375.1 hypothetical protein BFL43_11665 [Williamsia sp. 1135]